MKHTPDHWKRLSRARYFLWVDEMKRANKLEEINAQLLEACEVAMEWAASYPLGMASTLADHEASVTVYLACDAAIAAATRGQEVMP